MNRFLLDCYMIEYTQYMITLYQNDIMDNSTPFRIFSTDMVEFPPHTHGYVEIIYNTSSSFKVKLRNKVYELEFGDLLIVGPREIHSFIRQKDHQNRLILQFRSDLLGSYCNYSEIRKLHNPLIKKGSGVLWKRLRFEIEQSEYYYRSGKVYSNFKILSSIYNIISLVMEFCPFETLTDDEVLLFRRHNSLDKVFSYIRDNIESEITLDTVSGIIGYSSYHFSRLFKESIGMTFLQYLNQYKVTVACELLQNTNLSILEISYRSGFKSIATFNRVFRSVRSCSPTSFRLAKTE